MYTKHFGLNRFPFDRDIAVEDMFQSRSMQELSVRLLRRSPELTLSCSPRMDR